MHVHAVGLQVDDGIADDLSWTMVRDVAAATRLVDLDAACGQNVGKGKDMAPSAIAANAERQNVRVFDEEQLIADDAVPPPLDQFALQGKRIGVRDTSEPPDFNLPPRPSAQASA